ncbi:MAG: hypothetical protein P5681_05695 [Limnospira sp. PMC 894.15]|uniref:ParB/Sulfiredoxin domain-containing protein n=1 Tax=Limnospira fusiformis PMC 851.14 TaxID=2219512 RepID=A0ABU9EMS0_LIMFS|nr:MULTISPECIES: hypothetical protein [unclassified Limnospira]MDT9187294.1 hypothetical protein [Limnospira sp. PMC 894.15]MDT9233901.1 hypothetical protein [Limnospira sp. PMC 917.15]MDT9273927.1 hypothetical protein [Limnospira sp. PMC 737.11]
MKIVKIVGPEIVDSLNPYLLNFVQISTTNHIARRSPLTLITAARFDVIAKYIYVQFKRLSIRSSWFLSLYLEHIKAFNNYQEEDGTKQSFQDFLTNFDQLIDDIQTRGFDENRSVVPVLNRRFILDGSHRVATCLSMDYPLSTLYVQLKQEWISKISINYNYNFFRIRGMPEPYLDAIALEYCKLKPNTYIATIFPAAQNYDSEIKKIFQDWGEIVYEKSVALNHNGAINLIKTIYANEPWLGHWQNNFYGALLKASGCFRKPGLVRVFLIESPSLENLKIAKNQIREIFNIGNDSIHINDSHEETILLAQTLFNANSIQFLNQSRYRFYQNFDYLFNQYKNTLIKSNLNPDFFCIDSSSILAVYGIREARDLDYIHFGNSPIIFPHPEIASHNSELHYHPYPRDEIIFNPENHFYYKGLKFASLEVVRQMKLKRNEEKDRQDVREIDRLVSVPSVIPPFD